jgi:hypothetical protein
MNLPDANDARELSNQAVAAPHNDAFDIILNSAARKITKAVKNHMQSTVFQVPACVLGCPRYKITDVIQYVETTLKCKNYEVTSWPSGEMAILWINRNPDKTSEPKKKSKFDIIL